MYTGLTSAQRCLIISHTFALADGYSASDLTALAKEAAMGPIRELGTAALARCGQSEERVRVPRLAPRGRSLRV